jgi:hypothetical protein
MADADRVPRDIEAAHQRLVAEAAEIERKTKELLVFRDAGVITEAELEEQKARLHWGLP